MSDSPIDKPADVVDKPAEVVEEIAPPPDPPEPAEHAPSEDSSRPGWVDEIIGAINGIAVAAPVTSDDLPPAIPGDGDVVPDESPVKKPWTHRSLFGK